MFEIPRGKAVCKKVDLGWYILNVSIKDVTFHILKEL